MDINLLNMLIFRHYVLARGLCGPVLRMVKSAVLGNISGPKSKPKDLANGIGGSVIIKPGRALARAGSHYFGIKSTSFGVRISPPHRTILFPTPMILTNSGGNFGQCVLFYMTNTDMSLSVFSMNADGGAELRHGGGPP